MRQSNIVPTIEQIEAQLQQRVAHYPPTAWGRKQTDAWDRQTNFVYQIYHWEALRQAVAPLDQALAEYAINRWFSFWSAVAVEQIFCILPGVTAHTNQKDRLVDFSIQGINFDHKTSVFPQQYPYSVEFARYHKAHLIRWLYRNQSRQQRYHTANRLFILLYARDGEHWSLRAEISSLRQVIKDYVAGFATAELAQLSLNEHKVLADIIWFVK
ncbi:MAG: hypothetical protein JW953_14945 [Anaerolineae bacterium]|nr:hypothetical protein [Anaerolineae bacterium]